MSGVMGKFLVTGLVLSSIVACSNGSDGDKSLRDKKVIQYNTKSCDFDLTTGEIASTWLLGSRDIKTVYFGKEFNLAHLNAVGKASVAETIRFVNQTGATVYKSQLIETTECSKSLFADANSMPSDIQKKWDTSTATKDNSDSFVLGLYLPKSDSTTIPSLNTGAAIIVRENTNRWTLVHEFMHHLFMVTATEKGYDQDIDNAAYVGAIMELRAIFERKDLKESEVAILAVEPMKRFAASLDSMMVHFTMEEMAIEATLKDEMAKGNLAYIPANSNWYIYSSADGAKAQYGNLEDLAREVRLALPYDKTAERAAMADISALVSKRKLEMDQISRKYPYKESAMVGNMKLAGSEAHVGCSHQAEAQKIIKLGNSVKFPKRFH